MIASLVKHAMFTTFYIKESIYRFYTNRPLVKRTMQSHMVRLLLWKQKVRYTLKNCILSSKQQHIM
jgi:hypothetical protein